MQPPRLLPAKSGRHPRVGGGPYTSNGRRVWAPAYAGVTLLLTAMIAGSAAATAQTPQPAKLATPFYGDPAVPDISGLWLGTLTGRPGVPFAPNRGSADGRPATFWAPWPLPYTPAYQKIYDERVASAKQGRALGDTGARCLPFGMPFVLVSKVYPDEIVQTPGQVTLYIFGTFPLTIWTDGRTHPKNLGSSYNGHSIGHWVGDTLLVDTVGVNGNTPLDSDRDPHSAKLHIVWSIERVAADVLHFHVTLHDDEAFTQPVTTTNIWARKARPKWEVLDDQSCFENNQTKTDTVPEAGFVKF